MLTPCRRGSYQISHCEKFDRGAAALFRPDFVARSLQIHAGICSSLAPRLGEKSLAANVVGFMFMTTEAAVLERLRLGRCPQPRPECRKVGWTHCKELTETPMLTPSGRGSYQISHCEKFDPGRCARPRRIAACRKDELAMPELNGGILATDGSYGRSPSGLNTDWAGGQRWAQQGPADGLSFRRGEFHESPFLLLRV